MALEAPEARRRRLLELVRSLAVARGEFRLASGRASSFYLDARKVTLHPEGAFLIARAILDIIAAEDLAAEAIGGLTLGADPIAGAVAALSHQQGRPLRGFIVRKEAKAHGTQRRVEGDVRPGASVIVVDDVVTTAGSTLQAIQAVEQMGCKVAAVVCVIDREEGGREALGRYPFFPLFGAAEVLSSS